MNEGKMSIRMHSGLPICVVSKQTLMTTSMNMVNDFNYGPQLRNDIRVHMSSTSMLDDYMYVGY